MDADTPMVLAAARYADRASAVQDFKDIWAAKKEGEFDHLAVAVLTKDPDGKLTIERHDSTAKHLAWGGALLGSVLVVVAPPAGVSILVGAGGMAGAGALVGHLWRNIPKERVREASDLLDSEESGLLAIAIDRTSQDIAPYLSRAEKTVVIDTVAGDLDQVFEDALNKAQTAKAAAAAP